MIERGAGCWEIRLSGSERGRVTTRAMGAILWHRRETRRQTEKTNIALTSGECPIYSKPRAQALTALRLVETASLFLLITPCPHEGRTICNRPCSGVWRQLLGLRHILRRFCGLHHIFGEFVEKCWREYRWQPAGTSSVCLVTHGIEK